ncbi:MAG: hypothetical protein AABX70_08540 [Nanoarchaeota archaeon]
MGMDQKALESLVSKNELVQIRPNPIVHNTIELGLDEFYAFLLSTAGTLIVSLFSTQVWLLSIIGPLSEKPGFFIRHIYHAHQSHKARMGSFGHCLKKEMKRALRVLAVDIVFHDSIYMILAAVLLKMTGLHPGFISVISFCAAIPFAATFQYVAEEILHMLHMGVLHLNGLKWETYYESRFFFIGDEKAVLNKFRKEFGLKERQSGVYIDQYLVSSSWLAENHEPFMRMRSLHMDSDSKKSRHALEMGFRTLKRVSPPADQYNYHFIKKEKGQCLVGGKKDGVWKELPAYFRKKVQKVVKGVSFSRLTYHDKELSVSVDRLSKASKVKVIEVKVYKDIVLLMRAMQFLNRLYPVVETTLPKERFVDSLKSI